MEIDYRERKKQRIMKKRVLFITTQFNQGGVEKTLIEAVKVLSPEKYDITLLIRLNKTDLVYLLPNYVKVIVDEDDHYYREPKAILFTAVYRIAAALNAKAIKDKYKDKHETYIAERKVENPYKKYFKGQEFDVVISYTVGLCTDIGLHIPAKKHYVFYHSERTDLYADVMERCFPHYDKIVACGYGVEKMLRQSMPQYNNKIMTLMNYIDIKTIKEKSTLFHPYISDSVDFILCTCGRVSRQKGYDMAVKAARLLMDRGLNFKWYVVGDGDKWDEINAMIQQLHLEERFILAGNQENPFPYYADCDIYVQTSYDEAQPLAIMEALALGKPIVSTDTLGGRSVLENGNKGLLVPISPEGIADGIKKFVDNPKIKAVFEHPVDLKDADAERQRYQKDWEALLY